MLDCLSCVAVHTWSVAIVVVLLGVGLFVFVPSATVAISLQTRLASQAVHLNVTTDAHSSLSNKVLAQTLTHDFVLSGEGAASGLFDDGEGVGDLEDVQLGRPWQKSLPVCLFSAPKL